MRSNGSDKNDAREWTRERAREEILSLLTHQAPNLLKSNEISRMLGVKATEEEYDVIRLALEELEDEGLIFRTSRRRYGRTIPQVFVEGRLEMSKGGRGVVVPNDSHAEPLVVEGRNLWTAFHGDTVRAKVISIRPEGHPEGEITKVLERAGDTVAGTLKRGRQFYLDPDDRRMHRSITIRRSHVGAAHVGDKVIVQLLPWNDPFEEPEGKVVKVLGRAGEMNAEIAAIAATHRLPFVFPEDVIAEADAFPDELTEEDLRGRRDLRDTTIVTIDPYDARDFDDAISIEEHDDGDVTIGVHIADVSHYVREGSALDREAYKRGTSVYLVTGVIPMLPERLSNNLCSLRPDEDKLAYSVFVRLSPRGAIKEYEITKSVIRSKRRFTYEEALEILETGKGDYAHELLAINKMAHCLRANRRRKGSVDFSTTELKFKLDEDNQPAEVLQKRATESTKLIEDCMLLANRVVAEHVGKKLRGKGRGGALAPFVYRIHDAPPKEKLLDLANFVRSLGHTLPVENVQPKDIQRLVDSAKGTDEEDLINQVTLRSMAKAVYSEFNIGHFGLAFDYYTHFTSPIRRYPDLIVHRMLFEYGEGMSSDKRQHYLGTLGRVTTHSSERERSAVEAERESIKIAEVQFLKRHVGDVFDAVITGVAPFGIFVKLKRFGIEGMVSIRNVGDDYYTYDERAKAFLGRRTKKSYRLGDPVFARVIRVDEVKAQIDLEMIDEREFIEEGGEFISEDGEAGTDAVRPAKRRAPLPEKIERKSPKKEAARGADSGGRNEQPEKAHHRSKKGKGQQGQGGGRQGSGKKSAKGGGKKGRRTRT